LENSGVVNRSKELCYFKHETLTPGTFGVGNLVSRIKGYIPGKDVAETGNEKPQAMGPRIPVPLKNKTFSDGLFITADKTNRIAAKYLFRPNTDASCGALKNLDHS
jgi:hypothetical protein